VFYYYHYYQLLLYKINAPPLLLARYSFLIKFVMLPNKAKPIKHSAKLSSRQDKIPTRQAHNLRISAVAIVAADGTSPNSSHTYKHTNKCTVQFPKLKMHQQSGFSGKKTKIHMSSYRVVSFCSTVPRTISYPCRSDVAVLRC